MQLIMSNKDMEILNNHSDECRPRAIMELAIVDCLIDAAKIAGFTLKIRDFDHYEDSENAYYDHKEDLKDLLFDLDEATVYVFSKESDKLIGWVYLVFGNSGYDLVSNYTVSIVEFLAPVLELSKKLGG
jgi:hypothetical protein